MAAGTLAPLEHELPEAECSVADPEPGSAQWGHLDRLAKIGRLTAGIVHELNQPAAYVMVGQGAMLRAVEEIERELDGADGGCSPERLQRVQARLRALGNLVKDSMTGMELLRAPVRSVRDFARPSSGSELCDVNQIVTGACAITRHELCNCKDVALELGTVPRVACDPLRLTQVLVNLLVNAVEAIAARPGAAGRIRIVTSVDRAYVSIEVEDDGCGIPPSVREHLFEPFFSTKPDHGVGIGLWLSAGIVRDLGGALELESEPGAGARFCVRLPLLSPPDR
jgi:signal transduction histidine kinase